MWGDAGAAACLGAGAAVALLLLLALCRHQRHRGTSRARPSLPQALKVHIVKETWRVRSACRVVRVHPRSAPRQPAVALSAPPPSPIPSSLSTSPPQVIVPSNTDRTSEPKFKGVPKLPLPEQWLHKRPFHCKYSSTIPRSLVHIVQTDLNPSIPETPKKFSVTRSPSLEKDERSPFANLPTEVFSFDPVDSKVIESRDMSEKANMSQRETEKDSNVTPSNLKRFRSVSTRLNICEEIPYSESQEKSETQNSPRLLECSSAKEQCSTSKFNFSPKILAESISSPRFFTPPETISPVFFSESSPRSVYYDTVKSPKFFTETLKEEILQSPVVGTSSEKTTETLKDGIFQSPKPITAYYDTVKSPIFFPESSKDDISQYSRVKTIHYDNNKSPKFFSETPKESDISHSPRALGDNFNRNGEKTSSPRVLSGAKNSPKLLSSNKENYFTFDHFTVCEEGASRMSPRPKRYFGRYSIEKEKLTPPADREAKKYRRVNSCDTNYKNMDLNISKFDERKEKVKVDTDVVDFCVKSEFVQLDTNIESKKINDEKTETTGLQMRRERQRLKSISLDSDNAKLIEQNLGLPIAKQIKDQMNEAYKNQEFSTSCENVDRHIQNSNSNMEVHHHEGGKEMCSEKEDPDSPDLIHNKSLRDSSYTASFLDMPRFSPKEFEITVTTDEGNTTSADAQLKRKGKNLRNLTIDLTKRDSDLEKELLEFEKLYTDAEEKKVKTPTLKVKATSLDSSETVNFSLPQKKTFEIPQNSVSVPNTPKRQLKRVLAQKNIKNEPRRSYMKGQDSGIFLRENHANLMLYQPGPTRILSRTMGSFDENISDNTPSINVLAVDNIQVDTGHTLGSGLLNYKQTLSVSSTNLKTLPEGVPSDDFEPSVEDEKIVKKLHRRNSNQSLLLSTHSLQSSNCSINSVGASCHNLSAVRTSLSNFSLNSQKLSLERRDSNTSISEQLTPSTRVICSSNVNVSAEGNKNCLLQRRGSNNSLTLNIQTNDLCIHASHTSLNKDPKPMQKKGLLERRSSNTSLTLNINNSNPQLSLVNRGLSASNYNLSGYNSNQSVDAAAEPKKGILERRSSNTSLTLNIQPQEPRDIEIDESLIQTNLRDIPPKETHRKSLSTENLIPKSYKNRIRLENTDNKSISFGSHDNLWSNSYSEPVCPQNLTFVCGDQDNEMIYAFGHQNDPNIQQGFIKNITTKPLSPQSTSEDFKMYLANMQHLQNASSVLSRQQLRDLNEVFQNGYSKVKCHSPVDGQQCCSGRVKRVESKENPQTVIPEPVATQPCSEYQKMLLRKLHQEFWDMPTNFQEKPLVSGSHLKNRYKTILPNEHSRIILKSEDTAGEGYINANYIKGHEYTKNSYIATQGPLQNTIYDFWLMVHQNCTNFKLSQSGSAHGLQKIVMLTNFIENNRQKCEKYFPLNLNEEIIFHSLSTHDSGSSLTDKNSFVIKNIGMIKKSGYTIRKLYLNHQTKVKSDSMIVYHYWFHNWADHKCPKDVNALLNLSIDVLQDTVYEFDEKCESGSDSDKCKCSVSPDATDSRFVFPPRTSLDTSREDTCEVRLNIVPSSTKPIDQGAPPIIVHCSAGIGRTGCLIGIMNGIKQLLNEQKVDVLGIVCNMRLNRGGMVQNSEQYELIHKVLCLFEQSCLPSL